MMRRLSVAFLVLSILAILPVLLVAQQPAKGALIVQSTPGGAQVYGDDTLMGTTSPQGRLKLLLKPGTYTLRLSHQDYGDWNGTVQVAIGRSSEADCALPPASDDGSSTPTSGPSLAETLDFIRDALASYGSTQSFFTPPNGGNHQLARGFSNTVASAESCNLTIRGQVDWYKASGGSTTVGNTTSFNLADIDPASVSLKHPSSDSSEFGTSSYTGVYLQWSTTGLSKSIVRHYWPNNTQEDQLSEESIGISDEATAMRVAKALVHAIELCGGKKSAF
jgi:hypothetical protein